MRTITVLSVFVSLLSVLTVSTASTAASLEEKYLETRNGFIRQFGKSAAPVDDGPALAELEKQLRTLVGPIPMEGCQKPGRINLLTLQDKTGFGQVDGLRFDCGPGSVMVTTKGLLESYLAEHPKLPKPWAQLSRSEEFYRLAFYSDAAVICYTDLPVQNADNRAFAHAFLGVTAQDIGPLVPSEIFVFVSKGNRIFLVQIPAETGVTQIPQCRNEWTTFEKKSSQAFDAYRSSHLQNKKAIEDSLRYRQQGFEAYRRCYDREARNQPFFTPLKKQAQSIVSRLQKN